MESLPSETAEGDPGHAGEAGSEAAQWSAAGMAGGAPNPWRAGEGAARALLPPSSFLEIADGGKGLQDDMRGPYGGGGRAPLRSFAECFPGAAGCGVLPSVVSMTTFIVALSGVALTILFLASNSAVVAAACALVLVLALFGGALAVYLLLAAAPRKSLQDQLLAANTLPLRELDGMLKAGEKGPFPVVLHGHVLPAPTSSLVQGAAVTVTTLHETGASIPGGARSLMRQVVASDFILEDAEGSRCLIRVHEACSRRELRVFARHTLTLSLSTAHKLMGALDSVWLKNESALLSTLPKIKTGNLTVSMGSVVVGQEVAVLGMLDVELLQGGKPQLTLNPLTAPLNVAKFRLGAPLASLFPTKASGLVIADKPDAPANEV